MMPGTQSNPSVPAAGLKKKKTSLQPDYITEALPRLTVEMWVFFSREPDL